VLGDPESRHAAEHGKQEGVGDATAVAVRNALALYSPLNELEPIEIRLHKAVLYNSIYRADRLQQIAQSIGVTFALARQAAAEVSHIRDMVDREITLTPIGLSQYDDETLEIVNLAQPEYSLYVNLTRMIDDGEAATIAIAVMRSLPLATDDRKARRVCADLHLPEPRRTLDILHSYANAASLPQPKIREILVKIRDRASFQPPRNDPDQKWWHDIVDIP
jgi:predicted nucleic acid-binding protein